LCATLEAYREQHPKKLTFFDRVFYYLDAKWAEDQVFNTMLGVLGYYYP
jgi:hypothetical protein